MVDEKEVEPKGQAVVSSDDDDGFTDVELVREEEWQTPTPATGTRRRVAAKDDPALDDVDDAGGVPPYDIHNLTSSNELFKDTNRKMALDSTLTFRGVPFHRRLEMCTVLVHFSIIWVCLGLGVYLMRASGWVYLVFLAYIGWMFVLQSFHYNGGHAQMWFKRLIWWRWFRNYFPIALHRTTELDPEKVYIFGYHPHGIISLGAFTNFATEATHFSELFPGINNRLLTLRSNFRVPFYGLYLTLLGVCDASKESINSVLGRGKGAAVTLVLGGAKESLDAHPGRATLFLKNRKGFVKIGLTHGACLVPCYSFGENDLYDQAHNPPGSGLRKIQNRLQSKLGFALPWVKGRGVFSREEGGGLLPFRRPVNTVVGRPIQLPKLSRDEITPAILTKWHNRYMAELRALYDTYKDRFDPKRKESLVIT